MHDQYDLILHRNVRVSRTVDCQCPPCYVCVCVYWPTFKFSLWKVRDGKLFPRSKRQRDTLPLFIGERHTCHGRLLAFVSGLTNGPFHMARRARLRPDFGPASPPSSHRNPAEPPLANVGLMHHAESAHPSDIANEFLLR